VKEEEEELSIKDILEKRKQKREATVEPDLLQY